MEKQITIIRFPELRKKLGNVSRSTIDRWEKNKNFPKRTHLGKNIIGWDVSLVDLWLNQQRGKTA